MHLRRPRGFSGLIALLLISACSPDKGPGSPPEELDTGSPSPWSTAEQIPLDHARVLLRPQINDATNPLELKMLEHRALSFVLDPDADRVHVLDGRYGHDGRTYCIDTDDVARSTPKGAAATCPEGTTAVTRGALIPRDKPVAMDLGQEDHQVVLLTRGAKLFTASADVLEDGAVAHLALQESLTLGELSPPIESGHVATHNDRMAVVSQGLLLLVDGEDITQHTLPGAAFDLVLDDDGPLVATEAGVWSESGIIDSVGDQLVQWQDSWWLVQADLDLVLRLLDGHTIPVADLTGPAATDPRTDVLHLATTSGFTRLDPDGTQTSVEITPPIDLDINGSGETVLLHSEGTLTVLVDETAYSAATPLDVYITTFSERPRNSEDTVPCRSAAGEPSIQTFLTTAMRNRAMLDDMPAPTAMGLTSGLVEQATECDERDKLVTLVSAGRTSGGILVHEDPEECAGDLDCHTDFLAEMLQGFGEDLKPTWVSGMSTHHELDINWVASLQRADFPEKFLFFGMSLRPDINHHTDLRSKDPWPVTLGDMARAWSTDSAAAAAERGGSGWMSIYPGDDIPAFNLAGCENLFLLECHPLLRGGGVTLDQDDTAILDLLIHRALTEDVPAEVRTWSFHLPDIGTYDFTEGCTADDRVWSGDDCAAAALQEWLIDVDRRLVRADLVRWTRPERLEQP